MPVRRELRAIKGLGVGRPGLCELASHAANLDNRHAASKHGHYGHLELHPEGVPDAVGAELREALGTVSTCANNRSRIVDSITGTENALNMLKCVRLGQEGLRLTFGFACIVLGLMDYVSILVSPVQK